MKCCYLPLALLIFGCQSSKMHKTGIVYAGHFEILNKTELAESWNAKLEKNGIRSRLSTFKIRKDRDAVTDSTYYYLYAESYENDTKAATILTRRENYFYSVKTAECIVCSCLEGAPRQVDGKWLCESQTGQEECDETILAAK
ncbi:hypothetical protein [Flavobacterium selenitireducens]|uniref:hypothetical protein n=1 Tax=Flavobacterium selenitireducens TaxID=2722704 RepID=UPI00168B4A2D|nr:hypothetical protein [Flavobacterium selenitireducens]MBD3581861.1 hypothetical protein [Flavobacterium selenitireducens]